MAPGRAQTTYLMSHNTVCTLHSCEPLAFTSFDWNMVKHGRPVHVSWEGDSTKLEVVGYNGVLRIRSDDDQMAIASKVSDLEQRCKCSLHAVGNACQHSAKEQLLSR